MLLNSIGLVCRGKCRVADARIVELEEQLAASQGAEATAKAARQIQIERLKKAMKGILFCRFLICNCILCLTSILVLGQ